ncbi:MAG: BlaI/MecI/CopY family transcriptional regulator [Saprospiraceae bacterium]
MRDLTKAQEDIMQLIWDIGRCTVGDLRNEIEKRTGKKPPHSTVSAVVIALDKEGYLQHETYGRTFVYEPTISREDYGKGSLSKVLQKFFGNSPKKVMAHLIKKENLSLDEITDLMKKLDQ